MAFVTLSVSVQKSSPLEACLSPAIQFTFKPSSLSIRNAFGAHFLQENIFSASSCLLQTYA